MRLERRKIWLVGRWSMINGKTEFTVLSAYSTKEEAEGKLEWCKKEYTKASEIYKIQSLMTWFPPLV